MAEKKTCRQCGGMKEVYVPCPTCADTGEIVSDAGPTGKKRCPTCHGNRGQWKQCPGCGGAGEV